MLLLLRYIDVSRTDDDPTNILAIGWIVVATLILVAVPAVFVLCRRQDPNRWPSRLGIFSAAVYSFAAVADELTEGAASDMWEGTQISFTILMVLALWWQIGRIT